MKLRDLTPYGWLAMIAAVMVGFVLLASAWDNLTAWLPWSDESKLARAERDRDEAQDDAKARTLESQGQAGQIERLETTHRQVIEVRTIAEQAATAARSAPDADQPLPADRLARMRDAERRMCDARPANCRAAAPDSP